MSEQEEKDPLITDEGNGLPSSESIIARDSYKYEHDNSEAKSETFEQLKNYINDTFDELAEMLEEAEEKNQITSEDVKKIKNEMVGFANTEEKKENLRDFRVTLNVTQKLGEKLKEEALHKQIAIGVFVRNIIVDYFLEKKKREFDDMLSYSLQEEKEVLD